MKRFLPLIILFLVLLIPLFACASGPPVTTNIEISVLESDLIINCEAQNTIKYHGLNGVEIPEVPMVFNQVNEYKAMSTPGDGTNTNNLISCLAPEMTNNYNEHLYTYKYISPHLMI